MRGGGGAYSERSERAYFCYEMYHKFLHLVISVWVYPEQCLLPVRKLEVSLTGVQSRNVKQQPHLQFQTIRQTTAG